MRLQKKNNAKKTIEVPNSLEEENVEAKNDKEQKKGDEKEKNKVSRPLDNYEHLTIFKAIWMLHFDKITKAKFIEFCLNQTDDQYTTSMYCKTQVNSEIIILIFDSRSSGVHSEQKRPLEEIDQFSVTVKSGGKDMDKEDNSESEEKETDLDNESKDDKYKEENLLA
ncbi:hypothetical protein C2G38_2164140 [Gigaspora rosea]|uniref:Uncharacterized protein n=1 Tax=Gigaspora rosea TaxID=44941 RepID=A0A397VU68_9GLOM|nr:hypothetical protein C2G38_2164140 [Gigaspora rosea]